VKLLYTNFHDGDGGGHTTYIATLARHLGARHAIDVAVPAGSRLHREIEALSQRLPGVRAIAQDYPNGLGRLAAARRARAALRMRLREGGYDLVHVNGSADHRLVLSALRGLRPRPVVVWTKHNSKPVGAPSAWLRARGTDAAIAVSEATRRELLATAYARCAPVTIRNGIDTAHYAPWPADAAQAERARLLGEAAHDPAALLIGSNAGTAAHKGWMDLIEALATLPDAERGRIHVALCGKPFDAEARARIAALGLGAQVHHAGLLDDVRPLVAALDAGFVLSWAVETISFACRETMAMGKPVLVSDYAGLPENITPGEDGWVVPARDRAAIAEALRTLLRERERLPAMGAAARRKAERTFGLETFVDATEAAYRALLARG